MFIFIKLFVTLMFSTDKSVRSTQTFHCRGLLQNSNMGSKASEPH